ncbi:hypothetical protein BKA62DRAFT_777429 [Auriculariales sp. MPI-PUGE-AT-0066]|nr:hypothetical protein BKA62DRAFT_777429 [Auriculariales sp. MPI-PUGE-AT-0066]
MSTYRFNWSEGATNRSHEDLARRLTDIVAPVESRPVASARRLGTIAQGNFAPNVASYCFRTSASALSAEERASRKRQLLSELQDNQEDGSESGEELISYLDAGRLIQYQKLGGGKRRRLEAGIPLFGRHDDDSEADENTDIIMTSDGDDSGLDIDALILGCELLNLEFSLQQRDHHAAERQQTADHVQARDNVSMANLTEGRTTCVISPDAGENTEKYSTSADLQNAHCLTYDKTALENAETLLIEGCEYLLSNYTTADEVTKQNAPDAVLAKHARPGEVATHSAQGTVLAQEIGQPMSPPRIQATGEQRRYQDKAVIEGANDTTRGTQGAERKYTEAAIEQADELAHQWNVAEHIPLQEAMAHATMLERVEQAASPNSSAQSMLLTNESLSVKGFKDTDIGMNDREAEHEAIAARLIKTCENTITEELEHAARDAEVAAAAERDLVQRVADEQARLALQAAAQAAEQARVEEAAAERARQDQLARDAEVVAIALQAAVQTVKADVAAIALQAAARAQAETEAAEHARQHQIACNAEVAAAAKRDLLQRAADERARAAEQARLEEEAAERIVLQAAACRLIEETERLLAEKDDLLFVDGSLPQEPMGPTQLTGASLPEPVPPQDIDAEEVERMLGDRGATPGPDADNDKLVQDLVSAGEEIIMDVFRLGRRLPTNATNRSLGRSATPKMPPGQDDADTDALIQAGEDIIMDVFRSDAQPSARGSSRSGANESSNRRPCKEPPTASYCEVPDSMPPHILRMIMERQLRPQSDISTTRISHLDHQTQPATNRVPINVPAGSITCGGEAEADQLQMDTEEDEESLSTGHPMEEDQERPRQVTPVRPHRPAPSWGQPITPPRMRSPVPNARPWSKTARHLAKLIEKEKLSHAEHMAALDRTYARSEYYLLAAFRKNRKQRYADLQ